MKIVIDLPTPSADLLRQYHRLIEPESTMSDICAEWVEMALYEFAIKAEKIMNEMKGDNE